MKITKIARVHIPKHHRKWAGAREDKKKKNDLDTKKLDNWRRIAYAW